MSQRAALTTEASTSQAGSGPTNAGTGTTTAGGKATLSVKEYESQFTHVVNRLSRASIDDYYNPYACFDWSDRIETDDLWMSPDLMTVAGTDVEKELTHDQMLALSKWESIHFYSLNVHGIRELLIGLHASHPYAAL